MEIIDIKPRGYCKGVVKAIRMAIKIRKENPDTEISILGAIVHNKFVVQALSQMNIKTISTANRSRFDALDDIETGIVILSAHGSSQQVTDKATNKGLTVVDATCEDVQSTHILIKSALDNNQEVIYIGKNGHPESNAIIENFPSVYFVSNFEDINELHINTMSPFVTNQTTLSILEIQHLLEAILDKIPAADINNEICSATRLRQEAILKSSDLDALIVVGDPTSNNTNMLASIASKHGIPNVIRLESLHDLDLTKLDNHWRVGVTSGASTPNYLTKQVVDYLKAVDLSNPNPYPEIDYSIILD